MYFINNLEKISMAWLNFFFLFLISQRMLVMLTSIKEEKQQHLLDALSLAQQAVSLQEEVLSNCLKLLPNQEVPIL